MKPILKIVFLAGTLLFGAAACTPSGPKGERTESEQLFRASCQSCHTLPKPSMKSDEEWPSFVERYGSRAKLSQEEIDKITIYLISNN